MPTPSSLVALRVGGIYHQAWGSYEIDSDLRTPADAWRFELDEPPSSLPAAVKEGALVTVTVGGDTVLTGRIDEIDDTIDKHSTNISISGRDLSAVLVDCSAPVFSARQLTLAQIAANIVKPLGITKIRIDADSTQLTEKVSVEPGDTAWDALQHAAEANGLWPWFDPDGTLVIGGPDYSKATIAALVMRTSGKGNNIERVSRVRSIAGRHSPVTVLGQSHGTESELAKHSLKASVKDSDLSVYRPLIVVDHDANNLAASRARARKIISDGRLEGLDLRVTVAGHRTDAGVLWTPGQRLRLICEPLGIAADYFLMGRRFSGGRHTPTTTDLSLKEDGAWVIDAHPHTRKHRVGKNKALEIEDVG